MDWGRRRINRFGSATYPPFAAAIREIEQKKQHSAEPREDQANCMPDEITPESIYESIGVPTVINCVGEHTRISGTLMRPEAAEAMAAATTAYVSLADLQTAASKRIASVTGAERGYVTNGAASGLTLATAACMAGNDFGIMNQLPHTDGIADEVVIPTSHRNEYEVAFRLAGATLVSAGMNDLGNGKENVEPWEIAEAIGEDTAAVAYIDRKHNQLPLEPVIDIAHDADVPVIVDAAAELPPSGNLTRYIDAGADLVAFSGGKAIRGPQTTGLLAGRRDLIESVALQHLPSGGHENVWDPPSYLIRSEELPGMPRHGIGRAMKVGKEEIVAFLVALDEYVAGADEERLATWNDRADRLQDGLKSIDNLLVTRVDSGAAGVPVTLRVSLGDNKTTTALVQELRAGDPRVIVGEGRLDQGYATINPKRLQEESVDIVIERMAGAVDAVT